MGSFKGRKHKLQRKSSGIKFKAANTKLKTLMTLSTPVNKKKTMLEQI
jgi:hypothetical protein